MKKLILCLLLLASPATADRKSFGNWVVLSQETDRGRSCVAGVANGNSDFRFLINDESDLVLRFRIENLDLNANRSINVRLKIDDNSGISITAAAAKNIVQISLPRDKISRSITRQILDGNTLSLLGNLGQTAASFSLRGSGQALRELMKCQTQ